MTGRAINRQGRPQDLDRSKEKRLVRSSRESSELVRRRCFFFGLFAVKNEWRVGAGECYSGLKMLNWSELLELLVSYYLCYVLSAMTDTDRSQKYSYSLSECFQYVQYPFLSFSIKFPAES